MGIKETLVNIVEYYHNTRGVGHTFLAKTMADIDGVLVVVNKIPTVDCSQVLVGDFYRRMVGKRDPIIFDNNALSLLFSNAVREINRLEGKISTLERKIKEVA